MRITSFQEMIYTDYLNKLHNLAEEQSVQVSKAAEFGDKSENAEYDTAQLELLKTRKKIDVLSEVLAEPTIITDTSNGSISVGCFVKIRIPKCGISILQDEGEWYHIVENAPISVPNLEAKDYIKDSGQEEKGFIRELTITSIVGRCIFGKFYSDTPEQNRFSYTDYNNMSQEVWLVDYRQKLCSV